MAFMSTTSPAPHQHALNCICPGCIRLRRAEVDLGTSVVRYESPEDRGTECRSLYLATCEPPKDAEARIVVKGGRLLAEADQERCAWNFSALGKQRIEAEAHAEYLRDAADDWAADEAFADDGDDEEEDSWMDAVGE